jgi:hypothetical protein
MNKWITSGFVNMKSILDDIICQTKTLLREQHACRKGHISNPFDALAREQQAKRLEAEEYRYFVKTGLVNIEEAKRLYKWFDEDGEIRDPSGKTRISLLRKLSDGNVAEVIKQERPRYRPSRLVEEIRKRIVKIEERQ